MNLPQAIHQLLTQLAQEQEGWRAYRLFQPNSRADCTHWVTLKYRYQHQLTVLLGPAGLRVERGERVLMSVDYGDPRLAELLRQLLCRTARSEPM